jgi:TonB family protein
MSRDPLALPVEREENFVRTLLLVLAAHAAVILAIWLAAKWWKKPAEQIVWLDGGGELGGPAAPAGAAKKSGPAPSKAKAAPAAPEVSQPPETRAPDPEPPAPQPPPPKPAPPTPVEKPLDLAEKKSPPKPTPAPTPRPKPPTPEPKKETKITRTTPPPKKEAQPASKPPAQTAKVAPPKPPAKPASVAAPKPQVTAENASGSGKAASSKRDGDGDATNPGTKGGPGAPGGSASAIMEARMKYGDIVGNRFKMTGAPTKPTSVSGERDFSVLMRFKIGRDGTVMSVVIVSPSGNAPVDEWITSTIPKFERVPPPPPELLRDGVYEDSYEVIYTL